MEFAIIEKININSEFKYLWLKYVDGYDLENHCAKSLVGNYSKKIHNKLNNSSNLVLNEFNSRIYYLCGVSAPFNYYNNFHLAFKYSEGNFISIKENGVSIKITNAERIDIKKQDIYNHKKGENKQFYTCRNWQFAYQQRIK
tara:strand:+ start:2117 stop:2542 length:426 start_codon:yes stop_codon:yes gene_type:complete